MSIEQDVLMNEIKTKVKEAIEDPTAMYYILRYEFDDKTIRRLHFTFCKTVSDYITPSLVISCRKIYRDGQTKSIGGDVIALDYGEKFIIHFATSIIFKRISLIRKEIRKSAHAERQMENVMRDREVRSLESTDTTDSSS